MHKEAGLLYTDEQVGRLNSVAAVSVVEQSSGHQHLGEESFGTHLLTHYQYLHMDLGKALLFPMGLRHGGSLTWLCPCQTLHIHSGLHWLSTFRCVYK